jgi:hypothetical protein
LKEKTFSFLNTYSFRIVATSLVFLESILILKGEWAGDFWEHSAVVKELSEQLLHPRNPIIKSETPHAFFSPYSLLVAVFSRTTGLSSIHALSCFAFFNLLLFIYSYYRFCTSVFKENYQLIATFGLLFILFFYGERPFQWSGFYHIRILNYVLPYPSTFAISISFLVLALVARDDAFTNYWNIAITIILSSIVFITHPTTAVFLYIGISALNFSIVNTFIKKSSLRSAIVIFTSIALSLLWPYYNMLDLLLSNGDNFNTDSQILYKDILQKNWPLALMAISLMILTLILGYLTNVYGFSRLISNVMLFAHFLIAYLVVLHIKEPVAYSKWYFLVLGIAIILSLNLNFHRFLYSFNIFRKRDTVYYEKYSFLKFKVAPDDIVLSDAESSFILISYNGKVVSSKRPLYWIDDIDERRAAVETFFNRETPDDQRNFILQKYQPDYILIDHIKVNLKSSSIDWLRRLGKIAYTKDNLELIKLK